MRWPRKYEIWGFRNMRNQGLLSHLERGMVRIMQVQIYPQKHSYFAWGHRPLLDDVGKSDCKKGSTSRYACHNANQVWGMLKYQMPSLLDTQQCDIIRIRHAPFPMDDSAPEANTRTAFDIMHWPTEVRSSACETR